MRTLSQLIPAGERSHRDAVALGDASHGLPRLDYMDAELDGRSAIRLELSILNPGLGKALRGSEGERQETGSPGRCVLVPELRVELPESVQAQASERRHPRQLHALGYRSQLIGERAGLRGRETVSLRLAADQGRGLNRRDEVLGLVAQHLPSRQLPEVPRAENAHGPQDFHL